MRYYCIYSNGRHGYCYFQVLSSVVSIQGRLLFERGVNSLSNGKPSERNVLLRQRCARAPRILDGMYSILGRDPDCYPRT